MIAMWMLRLLVATAMIALAARVAAEAARGFGWPRRWVWAGAFVLAASLPWLGGLMPTPSLSEMLLDRLMPTVTAAPAAITTGGTAFASTARPDAWGTLLNAVLLGSVAAAADTIVVVGVVNDILLSMRPQASVLEPGEPARRGSKAQDSVVGGDIENGPVVTPGDVAGGDAGHDAAEPGAVGREDVHAAGSRSKQVAIHVEH